MDASVRLATLCLALLAGLAGNCAAAEDPLAFLEACVVAAGGQGRAAATTCFGQVTQRCLVATELTTRDLVTCTTEEFAAWQDLMEDTLQRLAEGEPAERMTVVLRAQEVWVPWRDARCAIYNTFEGSLFRPLAVRCLADTTADRVVDLWQIERGLVSE